MALFRVCWTIDLDAASPEAAAGEALKIHRDPFSEATVFDVVELAGPVPLEPAGVLIDPYEAFEELL